MSYNPSIILIWNLGNLMKALCPYSIVGNVRDYGIEYAVIRIHRKYIKSTWYAFVIHLFNLFKFCPKEEIYKHYQFIIHAPIFSINISIPS